MSEQYTTTDGEMPEEFHKKHFLNNSNTTIYLQCNYCGDDDSFTDEGMVEDSGLTIKQAAAEYFYEEGWRYCELPDAEVEGVFCSGCIRDENGKEDDNLQQPVEKEAPYV